MFYPVETHFLCYNVRQKVSVLSNPMHQSDRFRRDYLSLEKAFAIGIKVRG